MPNLVVAKRSTVVLSSDKNFYGSGVLSGSVSQYAEPANIPLRRKVFVHRQDNGRPLRVTWSSDAGQYAFNNLPLTTVFVIAFDHTGQYGGECETDIVVPEP